jgi:hypothetical protein
MVTINTSKRFYPQHDADKPVSPKEVNTHYRFILDNVYDIQAAIQKMMGNPVIIAALTAGAVSSLTIAYPAFGFPDGTYPIIFSGGGGTGAKGTAKASGGKIVSTTLTAGGAYATPPSATVALP